MRVDRLEWLTSRRLIEDVHLEAGRRLERDWKSADLTNYVSSGVLVTCSGSGNDHDRMSVSKLEAIRRVGAALSAVGKTGELVLIDLIVHNLTLTVIARNAAGIIRA